SSYRQTAPGFRLRGRRRTRAGRRLCPIPRAIADPGRAVEASGAHRGSADGLTGSVGRMDRPRSGHPIRATAGHPHHGTGISAATNPTIRMNLHTSGHSRGVAAATHHAAAEAGRAVLAEGGNALEAMVAMAATIAVAYPHMNHLGGDGFWLFREPGGRVRALMAAGRAGAKAKPELYREPGYDFIPARGPLAALTVPGAVSGWTLALEAARALGGRLPLDVLFDHPIRLAREGSAVVRSQAQLSAEKLSELKDV